MVLSAVVLPLCDICGGVCVPSSPAFMLLAGSHAPGCSAAKFNGVHSIDLHFPANYGADATTITFIGFRGEFSERRRQAVEAVYETKPMPQVSGGITSGTLLLFKSRGPEWWLGVQMGCCACLFPLAGSQGAGGAGSGLEPGHVGVAQ